MRLLNISQTYRWRATPRALLCPLVVQVVLSMRLPAVAGAKGGGDLRIRAIVAQFGLFLRPNCTYTHFDSASPFAGSCVMPQSYAPAAIARF